MIRALFSFTPPQYIFLTASQRAQCCSSISFHIIVLSENDQELGRYLYANRDQAPTVIIEAPQDSEDVKLVKSVISAMICLTPSDRLPIGDVEQSLEYLHASVMLKERQRPSLPGFLKGKAKGKYIE